MNIDNFVFSASSIKDFLQCGLKFKYSKVEKKERAEDASHHRWFGTLVHEVIYSSVGDIDKEGNYSVKSSPISQFPEELFETLWEEREPTTEEEKLLQEELGPKPTGRFLPGRIKALGKDNPDVTQEELERGWKEAARNMITNGIQLSINLPIVDIEKKLNWTIRGRSFLGYSDLIAKNNRGIYSYYDFKTAWGKPSVRDMEEDFQFVAYSLALKEAYNLDYYPKGYYVHLKSGTPIEYRLLPFMHDNMMEVVQRVFDSLEKDLYLPDYGGPLCKFCDFRRVCYGSDDKIWRRTDNNF